MKSSNMRGNWFEEMVSKKYAKKIKMKCYFCGGEMEKKEVEVIKKAERFCMNLIDVWISEFLKK
jgi:hypothetical protein